MQGLHQAQTERSDVRLMLRTWLTAVQETRTSPPHAKWVDNLAWIAETTAACVIRIVQNRMSVPSTVNPGGR